MQIFAVFAKHNEWYCQEADQKYQICRKCKTLDENCEEVAPKDCKCENLKFIYNGSGKLEFIPKGHFFSEIIMHFSHCPKNVPKTRVN